MNGLCDRCRANASATTDDWCDDCILEVETILAEEPTPLTFRPLGTNGSYTMEDVARRVAEYEDEYGLPSDALLEMHRKNEAHDALPHLRGFDRHVWLSFYRELLEHGKSSS